MTLSHFKNHQSQWLLAGLLLVTVLVFFKTLFFEFVWDDLFYLVGQAAYQSPTLKLLLLGPLNGVEYLPLRDLSYIIDYRVWGWEPFGFHLSNLLLYILNVWAVYHLTFTLNTVLFKSGGDVNRSPAAWTALATAALFALLPLHSEVVSFIHARNVLLSGLFFFLSCIYFLKFIDKQRWSSLVVACVFFALALLSKATVIMLPLLLLMFLYFKPIGKMRGLTSVLPFFVLAVVFFFVFRFQATESQVINEQLQLNVGRYDLVSRIAVAVQIPFFYLAKLAAPLDLSTEYQLDFNRDMLSAPAMAALLGLGLLLAAACLARRRFPQALLALLWFLICLLPVANFFLTNPVVADRYVYLSSYAWAYFLVMLVAKVGTKLHQPRLLMILLPVIAIYAWMAFERNDVWRTNVTVMEDMTRPGSNQVKGYNTLGEYYFRNGQHALALEYFRQAREISPAFSRLEFYQARLAFQQNRPREALDLLDAASRVNEQETYDAWILRGQIYESLGETVQAVRSYRRSLQAVHPNRSTREQATTHLQRLMAKLNASLETQRREVAANPGDLNRKARLAVTLQDLGLNEEAISLYEDLLRLGGPRWEVYTNLGKLYLQQGQLEASLENYRQGLALNDRSARIHSELGIAYIEAGQLEPALHHIQTAVELDPGSGHALLNLAKLHFQLGNDQQARQSFNRLLTGFPEYEMLAREYLQKLQP